MKTLSGKNKNRVNTHDNTCHSTPYVTIKQVVSEIESRIKKLLSTVEDKINTLKHNDLKGVNEKEHINGTAKQKNFTIPLENIEKINHNKLVNYNEKEHIDWTENQKNLTIPVSNIEAPDHNKLVNYNFDNHIPHSKIEINSGIGLYGGGSIDTSRTLHLRAATPDRLGGVKVGDGLFISKEDKKLSVDSDLFSEKSEFYIEKDEGIKNGSKYDYSINKGLEYPIIFCGDIDNNKVVYPDIKKDENGIIISLKRKPKLLVKILQ